LSSLRFSSLHHCVRYDPPPYIVQLLLAVSPESISHVDCLHRTPLHISAGTRAKLSIVQLLADAYPAACFVQDVDGKTPLILGCDSSCGDPPSIELIRTFIKAYPTSLSLEDNDGTSALEHDLKYIREPASIVEDAILMGTPNHISLKSWEACRRVVAGRLINCYSRKDLILSLMFQMKRFQGILRPVCGTSPVSVNGSCCPVYPGGRECG
jgi:hypothetical protein